ncbi:hypothetical protein SAMN05216371_7089 [Streptomyces sp. TLI_053]|uniref:hypothetical protein n=1 Tax=Streptomyces sp. TLI_053 TaxID=1855352 RepID=UPI00087CCE71|nr:hypothetical protein [Streptomyces sp. TLI_053]SDT82305.1 hypothetical protein SAMN05216371_7089 [Streptomyces sp. TLI_053]
MTRRPAAGVLAAVLLAGAALLTGCGPAAPGNAAPGAAAPGTADDAPPGDLQQKLDAAESAAAAADADTAAENG